MTSWSNPLALVLSLLALVPPLVLLLSVQKDLKTRGGAFFALSFLSALVAVGLALGFLIILRHTGLNQFFLYLETDALYDYGSFRFLPGLFAAGLCEEAGKLVAVYVSFQYYKRRQYRASQTFETEAQNLDPRLPAAFMYAAGLLFAAIESVLFSLSALPFFMLRQPGTYFLHGITLGILGRAAFGEGLGKAFIFTTAFHILFNFLLLQKAWWPLGSILLLLYGLTRLFKKSKKTEA